MEERHMPDPEEAAVEQLASVLGEELRKEGMPSLVLSRLASQPSLVHKVVEIASADLVTIPDLSATELIAHMQHRIGLKHLDYPFTCWAFDFDRHGQFIGGRGRIFEVATWSPQVGEKNRLSSEAIRAHFAERGYSGHVGAYLAWHLALGERRGSFACIPDDDACYLDPRLRLWVPYSYAAPGNTSLRLCPQSEPWDSPVTFIAFRPLNSES